MKLFSHYDYSRLRFRSKIPLRVFCISLRTMRRGRKFDQICQLSQEERQRIQTTCDGDIQRIAINLPLVKIAQNFKRKYSTPYIPIVHTNMSLFNKKHCAINASLNSLDRCNATWRIFFLVSPYLLSVLHTVLGEISISNTCIISTHNSPRYIDGFSKITPTTYNSLRRSNLLQSSLFCGDRGSTVPLSSNNPYIRCYSTVLTATFKFCAIFTSGRFIAILW